MTEMLSLRHVKSAYRARKIIWLLAGLFIAIVVWASLASLDQVVVAEGKLVPSQSVQQIQSLEGGIVRHIHVNEGDEVQKDQILLVLDNTRFSSAFDETAQSMLSLRKKKTDLLAQLASIGVDQTQKKWQQSVSVAAIDVSASSAAFIETIGQLNNQLSSAAEQIFQQEQRLAEARSNTLSLSASKLSLDKESQLITDMVKEGVVPEVERLQLERQQIDLTGQIDSARLIEQQILAAIEQAKRERLNIALTFRAQAQNELDSVTAELSRLEKNQLAVADALKRTELRSPVHGIVKHINSRSVNGVVQPGEVMMDIVPVDDNLLVEAHVQPKDIGFLTLGLKSMVKFTAFDFVVYGGLDGELIHISPDALQKEDGSTYYKVYIQTQEKTLDQRPLISGMQASVDIITGRKTVLSYWLKPFLRAKANALREH